MGGGVTLQPTALVNEFVARLLDRGTRVEDRTHFMALAAVAMRGILVDHARSRRRQKRGGDYFRVTLTDNVEGATTDEADMVDLDRALTRLATLDARKARILELQCFAGLNLDEIGGRGWRLASNGCPGAQNITTLAGSRTDRIVTPQEFQRVDELFWRPRNSTSRPREL